MLSLRTHATLDDFSDAEWNSLAADDNPFVSHAFLSGLERHGCVRDALGWRPQHLDLRDGDALVGALPLYLKGNSHGEYVFDWSWAHAWQRAGGDYYPKLLCAVPYSPVSGPRILAGAGRDAPARKQVLAQALVQLTHELELSSAHANFLTEFELDAFDEAWLPRFDWQFHWRNPHGWRDFADFLDALNHKRRKAIRHERAQVARTGIACEFRDGGTLTYAEWRAMHDLYLATFEEKGNTPTLTLGFFRYLGQAFPSRSHVAFARRDGRIIAGALFLSSRDTLYGRYWGAHEHVPGLHFELCYYLGIEHCLRAGVGRFEPGAQGEHKLSRGFLPVRTHSRHYVADERFREALASALRRESTAMEEYGRDLMRHSPFAQRGTDA
ncbi:MAG TPA: GNAT family N-acetyltransferase [Rhodanobacteraceae bacterium]|nr:GNAT family N-acetyltransferase [Rhodanobacteraceae bacterium]